MDRRRQDAARSTGENDIEKQAQHLAELMRSGEIEKETVAFLAFLGHEPAKHIIPLEEYQAPENDFPMTYDGRVAFFQFIEDTFGKVPLLSMLEPLLMEFKSLSEAYAELHSLQLSQGEQKAINVLSVLKEGGSVADETLLNVIESIDRDIIRIDDVGEGEDYDAEYPIALLSMARIIMGSLTTTPRTKTSQAFDQFAAVFYVNTFPPSDELLNLLPQNCKEEILSMLSEAVVNSMDDQAHQQLVDEVLLSKMKRGGLKWALKDVK